MLKLYEKQIFSRLMLGTAQYPSPAILERAIRVLRHGNHHGIAAARDDGRE